jgi:threonine synthase
VAASIGRTFAILDLFFQMISQKRDNVLVVAVRGDFDVCQNLVKTLMSKESTSQVSAY